MLGTQTLLGIAIDDFGVVAAEVCARSGRPEIRRVGALAFEEKLGPDNAKVLGQKLRQFLRANHFSSKRAVIGIPAKWIVTKEIVAPPAAPDVLGDMLGIQAERTFSLNASELIFDYCGPTSTSEKRQVLLAAAQRQIVDQIKEMADAAGLQVRSVTVSALVLGNPGAPGGAGPQQRYGLYTRPTYCEFWSQSNGRLRSVKHVPLAATKVTAADRAELLASTVQRLILLSSEQNQSPPHEVTLYDACGVSDGIINRLNKQLAPQITVSDGNIRLLPDGFDSLGDSENAKSIAAAALAITAVGGDKCSIDFLNPRIGRRKKSGRGRVISWAAVAAVVFVAGAGVFIADWHGRRADIATCTVQLEQMAEDITAAREMVDRISYASSWTSQRPEFLECLRQLTLAFPESSRVWATSLALSEEAEGSLVGKAVDEASFYEVLDGIKQNSAFSAVMMMHLRDAGGSSREKEFAMTFKFKGLK
ncbi:MAG: pilus assembly protein PilM [Planctomycetota bacterium]